MGMLGRNRTGHRSWRTLAGWLLVLTLCLCALPVTASAPLRLEAGDSSFPLSNAIRYSDPARPRSRVVIGVRRRTATRCELQVWDSGPGIPEKHLPFIFERFFRNPEQNLQIYGTGLGLYIARQIVLAHHGRITATSDAGKGVTFHIFLPEQTFELPVA